MVDVFNNHSLKVNLILSKISDKNNNSNKIEIQDIFQKYTLECICEIAFSKQLDCLKENTQIPFAIAFDKIQ